MNTDETQSATAVMRRCRENWLIRACCPFCGGVHHHGGGPVEGVPDGGLRLADCGAGCYRLALVGQTEAQSET